MTLKQQQPRWKLFLFDLIFYLLVCLFIFVLYPTSIDVLNTVETITYIAFAGVCIFTLRFLFNIYKRIWRYAGSADYLWMVIADFIGGLIFVLLREFIAPTKVTFVRAVSVVLLNLLGAICMRLTYQFAYQNRNQTSKGQRSLARE